jgi:hypothetical protein
MEDTEKEVVEILMWPNQSAAANRRHGWQFHDLDFARDCCNRRPLSAAVAELGR